MILGWEFRRGIEVMKIPRPTRLDKLAGLIVIALVLASASAYAETPAGLKSDYCSPELRAKVEKLRANVRAAAWSSPVWIGSVSK